MGNYRYYFRRRLRRNLYLPRSSLKIKILLILLLTIFIFLDIRVASFADGVSERAANIYCNDIINSAVNESLNEFTTDNIAKLSFSEDGSVTSVSTDFAAADRLKAEVILKITEKMKNSDVLELNIPIGSLTDSAFLNGKGPAISLRMNLADSVNVSFKNDFLSAGVNQTIHRIYIDINMKVKTNIFRSSSFHTINTNLIVAETVIVGKVPLFYAN